MGKRIKIIWILTIITALLMIVGQAYWLHTRLDYSAREYMEELHRKIQELEREECGIRNAMKNEADSNRVYNRMRYTFSQIHSEDTKHPEARQNVMAVFIDFEKDSLDRVDSLAAIQRADTFEISNRSYPDVTDAALRYVTDLCVPFRPELLDSLLHEDDIHSSDWKLSILDTVLWKSTYRPVRHFLSYRMEVVYPYNILKRKVATAVVDVPVNPLLKGMVGQLLGSLLLIVLLVCCFCIQIDTILKQYRLDELRKNFVNTMIHELKRPVQALKMCIAFLNNRKMRMDEQMTEEVLKDSMFELDNLSAYLAKVREMTRADYEHTPLAISVFNLSDTVNQLIRLAPRPADKHVRFVVDLPEEPLRVKADSVHLANCLSNLIENAMKYSGTEVCISVYARLEAHKLRIQVADNGMGIPPSEQAHVFEKFYRARNVVTQHLPGIGLGLSYVKLMVEAHGGSVCVESRLEKGTTFFIELPQ